MKKAVCAKWNLGAIMLKFVFSLTDVQSSSYSFDADNLLVVKFYITLIFLSYLFLNLSTLKTTTAAFYHSQMCFISAFCSISVFSDPENV